MDGGDFVGGPIGTTEMTCRNRHSGLVSLAEDVQTWIYCSTGEQPGRPSWP